MRKIVILLLGCHKSILLNDRVETAVQFLSALQEQIIQPIHVDWFLSGGIKDPSISSISEADIMQKQIYDKLLQIPMQSSIQPPMQTSMQTSIQPPIQPPELFDETKLNYRPISWNFIKDTLATNTAENFIIANKTIDFDKYSDIYVVTSNWHHNRAKQIADLTIPTNKFKWILGEKEYENFRQMEAIHIRNVYNDVQKALNKYNL